MSATGPLDIVILGLSITSSWGNGHATTYRALVRELVRRGHRVLFLERDQPWYAANRDLPQPPFGRTEVYHDLSELDARFAQHVRQADFAIVGSYVPDGIEVGAWALSTATAPVAFYDIDTPVTLARLERDDCGYLSREQIPRYAMYLSFTGGPTLERLEREFGSPAARALYCSVDDELYCPQRAPIRWDLGYLGTYSDDRQPTLNRTLLEPARRRPQRSFVVAGPQYPPELRWPANVQRVEHLPPAEHAPFYCGQRFTLNVTRRDMIQAGWSPSVRLFEAAACGVPILSDWWRGLDAFFQPGQEIFLVDDADDVERLLESLPEPERLAVAERARRRVLQEHTAACRARTLEGYAREAWGSRSASGARPARRSRATA